MEALAKAMSYMQGYPRTLNVGDTVKPVRDHVRGESPVVDSIDDDVRFPVSILQGDGDNDVLGVVIGVVTDKGETSGYAMGVPGMQHGTVLVVWGGGQRGGQRGEARGEDIVYWYGQRGREVKFEDVRGRGDWKPGEVVENWLHAQGAGGAAGATAEAAADAWAAEEEERRRRRREALRIERRHRPRHPGDIRNMIKGLDKVGEGKGDGEPAVPPVPVPPVPVPKTFDDLLDDFVELNTSMPDIGTVGNLQLKRIEIINNMARLAVVGDAKQQASDLRDALEVINTPATALIMADGRPEPAFRGPAMLRALQGVFQKLNDAIPAEPQQEEKAVRGQNNGEGGGRHSKRARSKRTRGKKTRGKRARSKRARGRRHSKRTRRRRHSSKKTR